MTDTAPPSQPPLMDHSTEQWFNSIQSPTPETPRSPRNKHLLIGGGILVLLAIAGTFTAFVMNQGPTCLDASDYKALTGSDPTDVLSPTEDFYTNYVLFETSSNNYDNSSDSGEHGKQLIQKIADFYKASADKSFIITISGDYFSSSARDSTEEHIGTVKSSLLNAGIPQNVISTNTATYIEPEDPSTTGGETVITVNSALTCK